MKRADPFKELKQVIFRAQLRGTGARAATTNGKVESVVGAEQSFRLSQELHRSIKETSGLNMKSLQLQVLCMQLGDPTPYRFHWPLYAELRINKMPYRVYRRGNATKLGANSRDDSFSVGKHCKEGANTIQLTAVDPRPFVLVTALVRPRSLAEVRGMMAPRESLLEAQQRMRQAINGSVCAGDDSDDDIEVLSTVISLKCPLTGMRVKKPARFTDVSGINVFDLDAFLVMVQRSHKWQCPHTMRNSCVEFLQVDSYLERVLEVIKDEPINEIEVSPEGLWRPAGTEDRFRDISEDPGTAEPLSASKVKSERVAVNGASSDEEDEAAEMLRAMTELSQSGTAKGPASPKPDSPFDGDVIVISDSDDDSPPAKRSCPLPPASVTPPVSSGVPGPSCQGSGPQYPSGAGSGSGGGSSEGIPRVRIPLRRSQVTRPAPSRPQVHQQRPEPGHQSQMQSPRGSQQLMQQQQFHQSNGLLPSCGSATLLLTAHHLHLERLCLVL